MRIWHKALILAVVTETVTVAWFVYARPNDETSTSMLALLHFPGIVLILLGWPWLFAILIEAALWMLVWFVVLRLFAMPRDELTKLSSADHQDEWQEPHVKKIVPR
jgi:predicted acyltransferase